MTRQIFVCYRLDRYFVPIVVILYIIIKSEYMFKCFRIALNHSKSHSYMSERYPISIKIKYLYWSTSPYTPSVTLFHCGPVAFEMLRHIQLFRSDCNEFSSLPIPNTFFTASKLLSSSLSLNRNKFSAFNDTMPYLRHLTEWRDTYIIFMSERYPISSELSS